MKDSRSRFWEAIIIAEVVIAMGVFYIATSRNKPAPSPAPTGADTRPSSLVGQWHGTQHPASGDLDIQLALHEDQTFRCILSGREIVDIAGQWRIQNNALELRIEQVTQGDPSAVGRTMVFGTITGRTEHQMVLQSPTGKTTYERE